MIEEINNLVAHVLDEAPSVRVLHLEQVEARLTTFLNNLGYHSNITIEQIAATDAWKQYKQLTDNLRYLVDIGHITETICANGEMAYELTEKGKRAAGALKNHTAVRGSHRKHYRQKRK